MSFTAWAQSHARSILFFLATLVVAGVVASFSLPVALFPHVSFPRVRITLDAGDRPAERMAIETPGDFGYPGRTVTATEFSVKEKTGEMSSLPNYSTKNWEWVSKRPLCPNFKSNVHQTIDNGLRFWFDDT